MIKAASSDHFDIQTMLSVDVFKDKIITDACSSRTTDDEEEDYGDLSELCSNASTTISCRATVDAVGDIILQHDNREIGVDFEQAPDALRTEPVPVLTFTSTYGNNLSIGGTSDLNGNTTVNANLTISGTTTLNGNTSLLGTTTYRRSPTSSITSLNDFLVPAGTVISFAGSSAPAGYLLCNGQAISRSSFSALFATIGTLWGAGDGSTTFNIPDLRGMFLRGAGTNSVVTASGGGFATGLNVGQSQVDSFKSHKHYLLREDGSKLSDSFVNTCDTLGTGIGVSMGGLTSGGYEYPGKPYTETVGDSTETRPVCYSIFWYIRF